jgi:hypothetical protein
LGFLVGKQQCFPTYYFNKKKIGSLLSLSRSLLSPSPSRVQRWVCRKQQPNDREICCYFPSLSHQTNKSPSFNHTQNPQNPTARTIGEKKKKEKKKKTQSVRRPMLELVVFFHETDHLVVAEADLLELVVGEVVGLVLALGVPVEAVEAGLGELLALAARPILHGLTEIGVALDAARRRPSALLLLLLASESGIWGGREDKEIK